VNDTLFWSLAGAIAVLMAVRVAVRFRNHVRAHEQARAIGTIHCRKCGFHGPLLGFATFFGFKKLLCPKCRSPEWDRSDAKAR
jgi:hypothetical protein